ncbi:MAG: cupin domain-containing protein [Longimicrobiales bacterium]
MVPGTDSAASPLPRAGGEGQGEGAPSAAVTPQRVEKPWGYELIWANTDRYVGKVLHVNAGHALSLQYHERKDETIHLLSGRMRFWAGASVDELDEVALEAGESYRVRPGTVHRMEALTDVDILEASTPDLDDVVRLEDRYGRVGKER